MMKRVVSILLAVVLALAVSASLAEVEMNRDGIPAAYAEAAEGTDGILTIPVEGCGVSAVVIYGDRLEIIFHPIVNRALASGLNTLGFPVDLKEIRLECRGQTVILPAFVGIRTRGNVTMMTLILSSKLLTSVSELTALPSPPEKVVFVHHDGTAEEIPVPEPLQDLIGRICDGVAESMDRGWSFWKDYSESLMEKVREMGDAIRRDAGEFLNQAWDTVSGIMNRLLESMSPPPAGKE